MSEETKKPAKAKKTAAKAEKAPRKSSKKAATGDAALYDILVRPVVTEKSTMALEQNKVLFLVRPGAAKPEIKRAVETLFGVTVTGVNTINVKGKTKRFRGFKGKRSDLRKAVVTLKAGDSIDFAAGVK